MTYTNEQLKQALEKMLPEQIEIDDDNYGLFWRHALFQVVLDTELLHVCREIEENLNYSSQCLFFNILWQIVCPDVEFNECVDWLFKITHASWQQRTTALAKTLGVEL